MDKKTICLAFQVHIPPMLKRYHFFDIGKDHEYFDEFSNRSTTRRLAKNCYLPMNAVLLKLIERYGKKFRVSFSISGLAMDMFEKYSPEVLDSFKELAETGCVEFLAQTYSHSLTSLVGDKEFAEQVKKHGAEVLRHFGVKCKGFCNTEMIYSNTIGEAVAKLGYRTILTEGARHILGWKSPNFVYTNVNEPKLRVLMRNHHLSNDIALRFSAKGWSQWPLTAEKYFSWINETTAGNDLINIFLDYEAFGEYNNAESGIFSFVESLPEEVFKSDEYAFTTVSETSTAHQPKAPLNVLHEMSWTDEERDMTAWLGNELQVEAFEELNKLQKDVKALKDEYLTEDYYKLLACDNLYYMTTKLFSDGGRSAVSPYESPYEAFINYMNVISDMNERIANIKLERSAKKSKKVVAE